MIPSVIVVGDGPNTEEITRLLNALNLTAEPESLVIGGMDGPSIVALADTIRVIEIREHFEGWDHGTYTKGHQQPHYRMNYKTGKPLRF